MTDKLKIINVGELLDKKNFTYEEYCIGAEASYRRGFTQGMVAEYYKELTLDEAMEWRYNAPAGKMIMPCKNWKKQLKNNKGE